MPLESTRAVRTTSTVAPCAIQANGEASTKSRAEETPRSVVCTCWGAVYEAGARTAEIVITPALSTVTRLETCPLSSESNVQLPPPPQAANDTGGVAVKKTLAPTTGVRPSAVSTRIRIGFGASPPTDVAGFEPA